MTIDALTFLAGGEEEKEGTQIKKNISEYLV